jgi:glycosyltransferase involved in cell wall biosynthesis
MKICLVGTFPPSGRQLNEYSFHLARELQRVPGVELTILADELTHYEFATDASGKPLDAPNQEELAGYNVIRCWKFGTLSNPVRLLRAIRQVNPDLVWFNLVFSSFATPENPVAAALGLSVPALARAMGYTTHVTLHHVLEHVDFAAAGVKHNRLLELGTDITTRVLLRASSVAVLLPGYRRTLIEKYGAKNVMLSTHGTFLPNPEPPDFSMRGNPEQRILAIGHWGTYKRLETLMAAFPAVWKQIPNAKLVVAGANHHTKPGYWEAVRAVQPAHLPIEFLGYVAEEDIPRLFRSTSVLVLPYDSATGSSGPAHQACEYGVPIVCADIPDLHDMAVAEGMAASFYKTGSAEELAAALIDILASPERQRAMSEQNYAAGTAMTMEGVVRSTLDAIQRQKTERRRQATGPAVESDGTLESDG